HHVAMAEAARGLVGAIDASREVDAHDLGPLLARHVHVPAEPAADVEHRLPSQRVAFERVAETARQARAPLRRERATRWREIQVLTREAFEGVGELVRRPVAAVAEEFG